MFTGSIQGLRLAIDLLDSGAEKINRDEIVEGYVDMNEAVRAAQANMIAIRAEDRLLGSLLDLYR